MVDHQKRRASKASEPIAIRIFENQRRYYYGGDFEPHKKTPWTLVLTNETCNSFEDFELPGSGEWCWISNWKIDMTTVETDIFGWEYASKLRRFQVQNRTHKPEPYSADLARRRRWVRFMSRSDCVAATLARMRSVSTSGQPHIDFEVLIPRIQNSLARVHSTRIQVEGLMISSDTSNSGPPSSASSNYTNEMQSFLLPLQVHIQEVLAAFESLEKQQEPPPTVAGVLKKLRNDVIKEQAALLKLLKPHQSKEEATPTLESQANGLRRLDNLSNRGSFSSNPFASNASSNSSGNMSNHYLRASLSEAYRNSQSTTRPSMNRPSDIENTLLYQSTSTFTKKQANNDDQEMKSSDGTIITTNLKSIQESEELSENGRSNGKNRLSFNSKKNEGTVTATFSPAPPVVNEYQSSAIVNKEGQDRTTLSSYSSGWGTNPVGTRTSTNKNTNIGASSSSSSAAVGVRSGNANTFNPSLLLATVPSTGKSDGMFVQRTAEEQRIDTVCTATCIAL